MKCVGINPDSDLVEIIEIPTLKWFIGTQFHPEYSSTVLKPHPLFLSFIKLLLTNNKTNLKKWIKNNYLLLLLVALAVWVIYLLYQLFFMLF